MNRNLKKFALAACVPALLAAQPAAARSLTLKVTNLTHALYFTPLLVTAHRHNLDLFEPGLAASPELQAMAEGGDISGLQGLAEAAGATSVADPAAGLLGPGEHADIENLKVHNHARLSLVGMLLPTNDGFVGLDSWPVPSAPGHYTLFLNGYDAGTEINDEIITGGGAPGVAGIPADPGGNAGTGASGVATTEINQTVHIHRGVIGDRDLSGGDSDLDERVHRWLNPVAKVDIWVK